MDKIIIIITALLLNLQVTAAPSITVSGISSGAFMAAQLGVIYSEKISGVGMIAGGFFGCAENHFQEMHKLSLNNGTGDLALFQPGTFNPFYKSVNGCMKNPSSVTPDINLIKKLSKQRLIDDPTYMRDQKIYIYHGIKDTIVGPEMKKKVKEFYLQMDVPEASLQISTGAGAHNFPTDRENLNTCNEQKVPFISSCGKNVAGEILNFLVQPGLIRSASKNENIYKIRQPDNPTSIASYGYLVSNQKCLKNPDKCKLHVALHGCEMSDFYDADFDATYRQYIAFGYLKMRTKAESLPHGPLPYIEQKQNNMGLLKFVETSGYADYVEKNNLMVLFPQTQITEKNYPYNPKGCWDWVGTTGSDYLTHRGVEPAWLMQFISSIQNQPEKLILK